jgi:hypothetical protein
MVHVLCKFFECAAKVNGEHYPTHTLKGLYRSFSRILRRHLEKRIAGTGIDERPFNMEDAAGFKNIGIACVLAMENSQEVVANKPRKKAEVVLFETKKFILEQ